MFLLIPEGRKSTVKISEGRLFTTLQDLVNYQYQRKVEGVDNATIYLHRTIPVDSNILFSQAAFGTSATWRRRYRIYINRENHEGLTRLQLLDQDYVPLVLVAAETEWQRRNETTN